MKVTEGRELLTLQFKLKSQELMLYLAAPLTNATKGGELWTKKGHGSGQWGSPHSIAQD